MSSLPLLLRKTFKFEENRFRNNKKKRLNCVLKNLLKNNHWRKSIANYRKRLQEQIIIYESNGLTIMFIISVKQWDSRIRKAMTIYFYHITT